jgi:hypothetical protein
MERPIKYKRFAETLDEISIQNFFDRLIIEGWEIVYYNEIRQASGMLTNSPQEVNIHVTVVGCKRQDNTLPKVL